MNRINRREFLKNSAVLAGGATGLPAGHSQRSRTGMEFYVSTNGNDNWSGSLAYPNATKTDGPFETLERARDAIRELKSEGRFRKSMNVVVRGGTYVRREPFVLLPKDSGTEEQPITYMAYPGERPIISGGLRITNWKRGKGFLWTAEIPEVRDQSIYFRQLFVNDNRRTRARNPNKGYYSQPQAVDPENPNDPRNRRAFRFAPGEIRNDWRNLEDVEVVVLQSWMEARLHIQTIDEATRTVTFTGASWRPLTWSKGFYVENMYEALDEPGEWYLDRKTGILSYWPMPGEDMTKAEVVAPVNKELLLLQGNAAGGEYVQYVNIRGFTFAFTAWTMPRIGYAYPQAELYTPSYPGWAYTGGTKIPLPRPTSSKPVSAAISAYGAKCCRFEHNELSHLGAWGIQLRMGSMGNSIVDNYLGDIGAGGIRVGTAENLKSDVEVTSRTLISHNKLDEGSQVYLGSPAIFIGESFKNQILHNEISGRWEWGISAGWNENYMPPNRARDNIIESNHLHHMGEGPLGTHAALYTAGIAPGTVIRRNLVHDIGGTGIVLDNGSGGILVEYNVIHHTDNGSFNTNFNTIGNIVRNNIFALGKNAQMRRFGDMPFHYPAPPNTNIFYQNIVYWNEGKLYSDKKWLNFDMVQDYNLYYNARGPVKFLQYDFAEWKKKGLYLDQHSLIEDPLFADPENGDFTLKAGSPAFQIGFEPIGIGHAGLQPQNPCSDASRTSPA